MTENNYDALYEAARAAESISQEMLQQGLPGWYTAEPGPDNPTPTWDAFAELHRVDARFIELASPKVVLELLGAQADLAAKVRALLAAAEVVCLDAGDEASGPEPDPNLAELDYCASELLKALMSGPSDYWTVKPEEL